MRSGKTADPTTESEPVADSPTAGVEETAERHGTGRTVIGARNERGGV